MTSLLATSADNNYLEQAKQLFSSAFHNAGWQGDYLLLAHQVPEQDLAWFRSRGILVKHCEPLVENTIGGRPAVLADRYQLFSPEFRKWSSVLYTDADVIIRGSLESLKQRSGFFGVRDWNPWLRLQVITKKDLANRDLTPSRYRALLGEINKKYKLSAPAFCAGFFFFTTDLLTQQTFDDLKLLIDRYQMVSRFGDQLIMNLFFSETWQALPDAYNMMLFKGKPQWPLSQRDIEALMLHFVGPEKPWDNSGSFRREWDENYARADAINLEERPIGANWPLEKIRQVSAKQQRKLTISRTIKRYLDIADLKDRVESNHG